MTAVLPDLKATPAATAVGSGSRAFAAPLNALDSVSWQDDSTLVAVKHIVATDPYLEGHYPDFTIYPGVFTIETVYQAAVVAVTGTTGGGGVILDRIESVRFQAPLFPGDTLTATLKLTHDSTTGHTRVRARCHRSDGQVSASIRLSLHRRGEATAETTPEATAGTGPRKHTSPGLRSGAAAALDHAQIKAVLPHRNPMLQVDRVDHLEPGSRIIATKVVSAAEACYRDLHPDTDHRDLRYPVSLVVESLGQTGGVLWLRSAQIDGRPGGGSLIFGSAQDLTVHGHAFPGDVLTHEVELTGVKGDVAFMRGRTLVGDRLILRVEHIVVLLREEQSLTP